jgi:hypothetical protein
MYKLLDNIMLVCRDEKHRKSVDALQAYLVDPSNKNQLKSARTWATWTEYGDYVKTESGKWEYAWTEKHEPLEYTFGNQHFRLELLDCAGGSSQGGKLSFWNCIVSKDNQRFKIGINSEMLLELLKNATFVNGVCQDGLLFVTDNGKVGMCAEGSQVHRDAIKDMELKAESKKKAVSKFAFGDVITTPTLKEVYLGTITQYYTFDPGNNSQYNYSRMYYRDCTITKLAKPITYHVFDSAYGDKTKISEFLNDYGTTRWYSYPDFKKTCPKRVIDGKLELDCSEEYFKEELIKKIYDYKAFKEYAKKSYYSAEDRILYYFLSKDAFGFGFEPFEIPEEIMSKIKVAGIRYIDETKIK